jgi:putative solute:sodium symporter small subunit
MSTSKSSSDYWKKNTRLIAVLLFIWALVSFGFGILMANSLSGVHIGKLPAGFWWAQQGSMYVFVALIFIYAWRMDKLDREHDVHEEDN